MARDTFGGDVLIQGTVSANAYNLSSGCVNDVNVNSGANIAASKLNHAHRAVYAQGSTVSATAIQQVVHVVVGATGTIQSIEVGASTAALSSATATVDLYKNGVSVLSGTISLTSGTAAYAAVSGTITTASVVAGDVLEVHITSSAGGGTLAKGLFVAVDVWEAAS